MVRARTAVVDSVDDLKGFEDLEEEEQNLIKEGLENYKEEKNNKGSKKKKTKKTKKDDDGKKKKFWRQKKII